MSWQGDLLEQARESAEWHRRLKLWWVYLDEPRERLWATTSEDGRGASMFAFARTLYGMDARFAVRESTARDVVLFELAAPVERLVVEEGDMRAVMGSLRRFGVHGRYRKAGTGREYEF